MEETKYDYKLEKGLQDNERAHMIMAIEAFKDAQEDNVIDQVLDMLIQLPPKKLSDALLNDLHVFMRTVWYTHLNWKRGKKK